MKSTVEMQVVINLSPEELSFLAHVLSGLTVYSRENLNEIFADDDFNRSLLEILAIDFGTVNGKYKKAQQIL